MQIELVDLDIRKLEPQSWAVISAIYVTQEDKVIIYYSGASERDYIHQIGHDFLQFKSGADEEDVLGGVVIEVFEDNSFRIRGISGAFRDKIIREESNEYIAKLKQEIMRVRA